MSKDLFMACWMGVVSSVLWAGGKSPIHLATLFACLASAGLEAGSEGGGASVPRRIVRTVAFVGLLTGLVTEAYLGTIRFLK